MKSTFSNFSHICLIPKSPSSSSPNLFQKKLHETNVFRAYTVLSKWSKQTGNYPRCTTRKGQKILRHFGVSKRVLASSFGLVKFSKFMKQLRVYYESIAVSQGLQEILSFFNFELFSIKQADVTKITSVGFKNFKCKQWVLTNFYAISVLLRPE